MRRFFIDDDLADLEEITLPQEEAKHIVKVLRMKEGDNLEIINGKGELLHGEIKTVFGKTVTVKKINFSCSPADNFHLHIAIAPTKSNERFEWFLEKAVELGIHEITPVICANSERKKINLERFQKIMIAATKQSKRLYLPKLNETIPFEQFIKQYKSGFIAHCFEDCFDKEKRTLLDSLKCDADTLTKDNTPVLIGPEGDFQKVEIEKAIKNKYKTISLGNNRLRTETAGLVACMTVKLFFEEILK